MILIPPSLTDFKIFKFRFPPYIFSFCEYFSLLFSFFFFFSPSVFNQTKFCLTIRLSFCIIYGLFSNYKMEKSLTVFVSQDIQTLFYYQIHENLCLHFLLYLSGYLRQQCLSCPVDPTRTATWQPLSTASLNECMELNPTAILVNELLEELWINCYVERVTQF